MKGVQETLGSWSSGDQQESCRRGETKRIWGTEKVTQPSSMFILSAKHGLVTHQIVNLMNRVTPMYVFATAWCDFSGLQEKLEKKKAEYAERMRNKMADVQKAAEEKQAAVEAKRGQDFVKIAETANNFRSRGYVPKKSLGCFSGWRQVCHAKMHNPCNEKEKMDLLPWISSDVVNSVRFLEVSDYMQAF